MIQKPKNKIEQLGLAAFEDLPPFTIVVNKPDDAMFLGIALMNQVTGDSNLTNEAMKHMLSHAKLVGVEASVTEFFSQADESGISYPEFLKPVLIMMFDHMFKNKTRIKDLADKIDKTKDDE